MKIELIDEISKTHIRPQLQREAVTLLDGEWTCNGKRIIVPFAPEASLSEYEDRDLILAEDWDGRLSYQRSFRVSKEPGLPRFILYFGAVDQIADVFVNDIKVGHHEGGYLSFSMDITEQLNIDGDNSLRVEVIDTLSRDYPYGKQHKKPHGMWYTTVSGIWKSLWIENVPEEYVVDFKLEPDLEQVRVSGCTNKGRKIQGQIKVDNPQVWTPENPVLYPIRVTMGQDIFKSYFALRTIDIRKINGVNRVCLNGEPIFMHGVLDQGYWPDGIYTPSSQEKYDQDIIAMKELGFNMLRKHVKVEADSFYFACDRLGMLVCQDMVQNGSYSYIRDTVMPNLGLQRRRDDRPVRGEEKRREFFLQHCKDTIAQVYNHPCVVMYTIFNEGWGQFDSDKIYEELKALDPSRLMDSTSGWFAQKRSDFDSLHVYFRNKRLHPKERPMFLKECGGYVLPVPDHLWNTNEEYGYGDCKNGEELTEKLLKLYEIMVIPAIREGLCGCIFTQLSDVENEINGLYTYDRQVCKVDKALMQRLAKLLLEETQEKHLDKSIVKQDSNI